jgi:hypothetical protein
LKRMGYVSLFLKKFPALLQERGMSSYLLRMSASLIAKLAICMINIAQNCQSLVRRLGFLLEILADNSSYHYSFGNQIAPYREEANMSPPLQALIESDILLYVIPNVLSIIAKDYLATISKFLSIFVRRVSYANMP